jgi:UrcA family protein
VAAVIGVFVIESIIRADRVDDGPRAISIRADDLDLRHLPDVEVLIKRIEDAAVVACGDAPDFRRLRQVEAFDRCRKAAIESAVRRLNQPMLTEIAETHTWPRRLAVR